MAGIQLMDSTTAAKYNYEHSWSLWFNSVSNSDAAGNRILSRDCSDYMCVIVDQDSNPNNLGYVNEPINLNTWYHLAVTTNTGTSYDWYLNGEFIGSTSAPLSGAARPWVLGANTEGDGDASGNEFVGAIDDVKFFDHKLSLREVRDLSQGKALHYGFDVFAESTENVVTNTDLDTGWSKGYTQNIQWNDIDPPRGVDSQVVSFENDDTSGDGYWYSYGDYAPQADGTEYQVSLYVKTDQTTDVRVRFYTADNSETDRYVSEDLTVNASEGWKRLEWAPFTTANPTDSDSLSFRYFDLYDTATSTYTRLWLCAPQMEAKDHATPFVNETRIDTVTDKSSQDYHAPLTVADSPKWIEDSKIGSGAYDFDGTNFIDTSFIGAGVTKFISVSAWIKGSNFGTIFNNYGGGGASQHIICAFQDNTLNLAMFVDDGNTGQWLDSGQQVNSDWNHIVWVYDDRVVTIYINGIGYSAGTYAYTNPDLSQRSFEIGRRKTTNNVYYTGLIDDLRVYATALTASEVEEIYQQRASLDDKGSLHVQELNYSGIKVDDFETLDDNLWNTFGTSYGSITVNNSECTITNSTGTSSDNIGIYSQQKIPVGATIKARIKNTSGRHSALVGFGESPYNPFPHGGSVVGCTWYSRADATTSTVSYRDETGTTGSSNSVTQNLTEYQVIELRRVSLNTIEFYRNDILEHTFSGVTFTNNYSIYFSADGHTKPNTIVIDYVELIL